MSLLPVEFMVEAIDEATQARRWYAQRSPSAARRFDAALDRAVSEILVYVVGADRIRIIAIQHGRRRPGYWRERLNP